ncbi:class II aldolase/adducin family protein, partial [Burkholderia sp. SIMBA_024]|uniref:class II aldolase/adducin family protein n=1 Tax=Burkholderia sp. SIMBA_024 TaxID=3085768 RepID=UPI003978EF08
PYGLMFDEVTASNLVKIDCDGAVVEDPEGHGFNPAGFTIHSAVHMARHDAGCVMHTHTEAGVAVCCQRDGILPVNQWALQYYGKVAY